MPEKSLDRIIIEYKSKVINEANASNLPLSILSLVHKEILSQIDIQLNERVNKEVSEEAQASIPNKDTKEE